MDDAFVLLAAWRRTNPNQSVPERLGLTYAEAAVSISITSLTNFISFMIGIITPFPSVIIFQCKLNISSHIFFQTSLTSLLLLTKQTLNLGVLQRNTPPSILKIFDKRTATAPITQMKLFGFFLGSTPVGHLICRWHKL